MQDIARNFMISSVLILRWSVLLSLFQQYVFCSMTNSFIACQNANSFSVCLLYIIIRQMLIPFYKIQLKSIYQPFLTILSKYSQSTPFKFLMCNEHEIIFFKKNFIRHNYAAHVFLQYSCINICSLKMCKTDNLALRLCGVNLMHLPTFCISVNEDHAKNVKLIGAQFS